jgi:type VI secretion system Hcp family effector
MKNLSTMMLRICGVAAMAIFLCAGAAHAQTAYIKIPGVAGTATDDKHKDWLEIHSAQWDAVQQRAVAERSGGNVRHEALTITKEYDVASPKLVEFCASGKRFSGLDVDVVSGGKTIHYHLTDVIVSSFNKGGGDRPTESITLNYGKITHGLTAREGCQRPTADSSSFA